MFTERSYRTASSSRLSFMLDTVGGTLRASHFFRDRGLPRLPHCNRASSSTNNSSSLALVTLTALRCAGTASCSTVGACGGGQRLGRQWATVVLARWPLVVGCRRPEAGTERPP